MSHLIVLVILGVIGLINYLVRLSASTPQKPGDGSRPSNYPRPQRPPQTAQSGDDERLRKFMEALGVPAAPPPPPRQIVRPQQALPRVQPITRKQPPRRVYTPPPPAPSQSSYQAETVGAQSLASTGYEVATETVQMASAVPGVGAQTSSAAADLKSLLRTSSNIRVAVLLKEILGTPKGLQSADVIPGLR